MVGTLVSNFRTLKAVPDAVGSKQAALFGVSEGGNMTSLFAATYSGAGEAASEAGSCSSAMEA
jgi:hypothetical protein